LKHRAVQQATSPYSTTASANDDLYEFKLELQLNLIGLTESVKGADTKFELWTDARQDVYTFQAIDAKVKDEWVRKIKFLLLENFRMIKQGAATAMQARKVEPVPRRSLSERPVSWSSLASNESGSTTSRSSRDLSTPPTEMASRVMSLPNAAAGDSNNNPASSPDESSTTATDDSNDNSLLIAGQTSVGSATALYNYTPSTDEELALTAGDEITVLYVPSTAGGGVKADWTLVLKNAEKGWVPTRYLQMSAL